EIGRTADTQFTVKNLNAETSYNFKIQAVKIDDAKVEHYGEESDVVTGTTSRSDKITQADIDAMKKELQEYSNSKAEYVNTHYTEFWTYGEEYNTLDEYYQLCINESSPDTSSYDDVYTILFTGSNIDNITQMFKDQLDYEYEKREKAYYVVYVETCPNGHRINSNPCWAIYFLY
ncbi:fibronectin type III domain-containing protein, partial [Ruminococcus bicirculans (ex Wegman et al. 2014)]